MLEGSDFENCINRSIRSDAFVPGYNYKHVYSPSRDAIGSLWEQGVERERLLQAALSQDAARVLLGMKTDSGLSPQRAESILLANYEVINKDKFLVPRS